MGRRGRWEREAPPSVLLPAGARALPGAVGVALQLGRSIGARPLRRPFPAACRVIMGIGRGRWHLSLRHRRPSPVSSSRLQMPASSLGSTSSERPGTARSVSYCERFATPRTEFFGERRGFCGALDFPRRGPSWPRWVAWFTGGAERSWAGTRQVGAPRLLGGRHFPWVSRGRAGDGKIQKGTNALRAARQVKLRGRGPFVQGEERLACT